MRICIDLDGVICELRKGDQDYAKLNPVPGAKEKLNELRKNGHYIIIHTARRMKTHNGNTGKVVADIGSLTLEWLHRYEIPFDEIYFGKPWADIYIDDNGFRFEDWDSIQGNGSNLPKHKEDLKT